jgi:hypothetical protein
MGDWVVVPTITKMRLESDVVELTGRKRPTTDFRYEVELADGRVVDASLLTTLESTGIGE